MNGSVSAITRMGLMSVILILCSWCTLPFGVPFTLQLLGVFIGIGVLGGGQACLSVLVYLLLGCLGLPVFAGFQGGFGVLSGPTGGYLLGLLPLCLLSGVLYQKARTPWGKGLGFLAGLLVDYIMGTAWYIQVFTKGQAGVLPALAVCVLPFVVPDIIKIAVSLFIIKRAKRGMV